MDIARFSSAVRDLLAEQRLSKLGPGTPNGRAKGLLESLTVDQLVAPSRVRSRNDAEACLAALWLHHDFQDEAHAIAQSIETKEGSYWHGILHRREPDYANATYWFRQVGRHPIFDPLRIAAEELKADSATQLAIPSPWDPFWFINYCEECAANRGTGERLARLIQQREWELLFEYCYDRAAG